MGAFKTGRKNIKVWLIVLILLGVGVLGSMIALLTDTPERQELQMLTIGNVDFNKLQDGTYVGEYNGTKGNSRDVTVEVTIFGGEITDIKILKGALDSDGNPVEVTDGMTMDDLLQRVIRSKSLQVDAISGATLTSKAHLKALENALRKGMKD
ncbi:FMN-binding protein [Alkaliphilus crotonatoxidans]